MTMPIRPRTSVVVDAASGDAPDAHRNDREAERSDQAMNTLANLYVAQHLQDLLDEAAKERLRRTARSSRTSRVGSALSSLRVTIGRRPALAV
jgi:hypothetical protein